jgi:hypothetical protein
MCKPFSYVDLPYFVLANPYIWHNRTVDDTSLQTLWPDISKIDTTKHLFSNMFLQDYASYFEQINQAIKTMIILQKLNNTPTPYIQDAQAGAAYFEV